jgi:hypothetical protein
MSRRLYLGHESSLCVMYRCTYNPSLLPEYVQDMYIKASVIIGKSCVLFPVILSVNDGFIQEHSVP